MRIVSVILAVVLVALGSGCLVVPVKHSHGQGRSKACPPAHHWEDGRCVHNGKAKGHHKHK